MRKFIGEKIVKINNKETHNSSNLKSIIILIILFSIVFLVARYITNEDFRLSVDTKILKKEVSDISLTTIEVDPDSNPSLYAYDKYIAILSKNTLTSYNSSGKISSELSVNIAVPIVETNGKYLVLAEQDSDKIYLISGSNIIWQKTVDGNIVRVNVNQNGYVSVVMKNTIYRSVVLYFDLNGNELFRSYISTNYAICTAISNDNKYLAIGEVDFTGTIIKSYIKILSVELAQTDPENSVIYVYEADNDSIITNIKYQDKNIAVCMFDKYIQKVGIDSNERIYDFSDKDIFADIHLKNNIATITKQSSGLFSYEYEILIKSIESKSENLYILNNGLPKSLVTNNSVMALNFGNEIQIVNSNGWMIKKYTSNKQISNIILGDSILGIVYKNRIEVIDF